MLGYVAHRLFVMIPTLLVISALVFLIINLPPGDFASAMLAELESQGEAGAQRAQEIRALYGLDKPLIEQYFDWLGGMLVGDFGFSFEYEAPVSEVVGERMALTVLINFLSILFIYLISFPIGVYSAVRQYSAGDYVFSFVGIIGYATPNFMLAIIMMFLLNEYFGVAIGGLMDPEFRDQPMSWDKAVSIMQHSIVPVIVIGTAGTAAMIRRLRANLLDELHKQYVITARAKGLPAGRALRKYPLRMSLNPFIADIGNLLPDIVSSSVIVSVVLGLETVGPMLLRALETQDTYLAGSFLMFLAVLTVIGMLVSDLLLGLLDPRIRLGAGATK